MEETSTVEVELIEEKTEAWNNDTIEVITEPNLSENDTTTDAAENTEAPEIAPTAVSYLLSFHNYTNHSTKSI